MHGAYLAATWLAWLGRNPFGSWRRCGRWWQAWWCSRCAQTPGGCGGPRSEASGRGRLCECTQQKATEAWRRRKCSSRSSTEIAAACWSYVAAFTAQIGDFRHADHVACPTNVFRTIGHLHPATPPSYNIFWRLLFAKPKLCESLV